MVSSPCSTYTKTWASCRCGNEAPPGGYSTVSIKISLPETPVRASSINCLTSADGGVGRVSAPSVHSGLGTGPAAKAPLWDYFWFFFVPIFSVPPTFPPPVDFQNTPFEGLLCNHPQPS